MIRCSNPDVQWQTIAPSGANARTQYAVNRDDEYKRIVGQQILEGTVQVTLQADGERSTATTEAARELHETIHDE